MSADNSAVDVSVPLRNVLNSTQCIRDRVKDGEPLELRGESHLSSFWNTLILAAKAVSQEATKLSLAFSKPPLPSQQDCDKLSEETLKSVLTFSTLYFWLPKSQGLTLRREIRDATVGVLEGVMQLVETILSSPLQCLSQEQLTSTGGVWLACDKFPQLSQDNKAAVLVALSSQIGVVKDALEEIEQALSEAQDPFSTVLDDDPDNENPRGNQDTYWSEKDRQVMAPCQGLMKVSTVCLRKLSTAIKANGDVSTPQNVDQLDDLADITKEISPGVDDLALCLYPPMDYTEVTNNVSKLAAVLKKVLEITRSSHVCGESELTWIQFLDGAVDHNLQKAKDLIQQNG